MVFPLDMKNLFYNMKWRINYGSNASISLMTSYGDFSNSSNSSNIAIIFTYVLVNIFNKTLTFGNHRRLYIKMAIRQ